jgi:hypothetical protein
MRLQSSSVTMLFLSASTLLVGCSAGFTDVLPPTGTSAVAITGQAQGGRQPIVGAHIYLLETASTAYAGPGVTATTQNASPSLLKSYSTGSFPTTLDNSGGATNGMYYVTTDASGKFSISSEYNASRRQRSAEAGQHPGQHHCRLRGHVRTLHNSPTVKSSSHAKIRINR